MTIKELKKEIDYFVKVGCGDFKVTDNNKREIKSVYCLQVGEDIVWLSIKKD